MGGERLDEPGAASVSPAATAPRWHRFDPVMVSLAFTLAASLLFLLVPQIDTWFSGLFYLPGNGFPIGLLRASTGLRDIGTWLVRIAVGLILASLLIKLALPDRRSLIRPSISLFLLTSLVAGPGIVVNLLLKNLWGRPRPLSIALFSGDLPFVGVWHVADYCATNCSFVSGEASAAAWLVACALIAPPAWRPAAVRVLIVLAALLSLNRIAVGAHFLSDVVIGWGVTALVLAIAYRYLVAHPPALLTDAALERVGALLGRRLRGVFRRQSGKAEKPRPA
ncbi:MAG TPA: phosphatase PAP2 family protein [Bauldia sp.]|nr:phosphatase PAP2 family protein [Bauldia sp.]